jgi:hypothetical protein
MVEIMARISPEGGVELADDRSAKIEAVDSMTPLDAAYLARGLLSCAAVLSGPNPPKVGIIGGDAHLPVVRWTVGVSKFTAEPVLILSFPPGIELTFQIWPQGAKELGAALIAQAQGSAPLGGQSGTVH